MTQANPWTLEEWHDRAEAQIQNELASVGRAAIGRPTLSRLTGRSCIYTVPTARGLCWIKYSYRLPPGEEIILKELAPQFPANMPTVIATWPGAVATAALPGAELLPENPLADWVSAAQAIATLEAAQTAHVGKWLELGVRDRRPEAWRPAVDSLLQDLVTLDLELDMLRRFEALTPRFKEQYEAAFQHPPTLVSQDSGCCNIHITPGEVVLFDWADVVIGHPVFSCDRLMDQTPDAYREPVIGAFCEALSLSRAEFDAMRRSNVLHEILRYNDELHYIPTSDPLHGLLANAVKSQTRVLVEFEEKRAK